MIGSTFSERWYRVADLHPRLHTAVRCTRRRQGDDVCFLLRDPLNHRYHRLDESAYHMAGLFDGHRTVSEVWQLCGEQLGDAAPTQEQTIDLLGWLHQVNLLQVDLPPDIAATYAAATRRKRREMRQHAMNFLFPRFPLYDPNTLLERLSPWFGWIFSRLGVVLWLVLLIVGFSQLAGRWSLFVSGLDDGMELTTANVVLLAVVFTALKLIHEMGHGLACKHFGKRDGDDGAVHTMGVIMLVITPLPYIDASSAWSLRRRRHRIAVSAAGMYVELAVGAIAAIVWANTAPGLLNSLAHRACLLASVVTLLFNANPLLRFDGYYILSDLTNAPNLYERSRSYLWFLIQRFVFGARGLINPTYNRSERIWMPLYTVTSLVYRVVICVMILGFLIDHLLWVGVLLAAAAAVIWLVVPVFRGLSCLMTSSQLARCRVRTITVTALVFVLASVLICLPPVPDRGYANGTLEARNHAMIFPRHGGRVERIAPSGQAVRAGRMLVEMRNPVLEFRRQQVEYETAAIEVKLRNVAGEDPNEAARLKEMKLILELRLARMNEQLRSLSITAPQDGYWIAPALDEFDQNWVTPNADAPIGVVASIDDLLVRVPLDATLGPRVVTELRVGDEVGLCVRGRPDLSGRGTIERLVPAGRVQQSNQGTPDGHLQSGPVVLVRPEMDSDSLRIGQHICARFDFGRRSLGQQWLRTANQLFQSRMPRR